MQNSATRTDQPTRLLCAWNTDGQFCEYPGTQADDIYGKGPFYCSGHYRCNDAAIGAEIVRKSLYGPPVTPQLIAAAVSAGAGREAAEFCDRHRLATVAEKRAWIKERLLAIGAVKPSKKWAHDLLSLRDSGGKVGAIQEELAERAVGRGRCGVPGIDRTPGEDDEPQPTEVSAW